jgi:type IV secretion system protein VirB8
MPRDLVTPSRQLVHEDSYQPVERRSEYYAQARNWATQDAQSLRASRKTGWVIASILILICAAQAAAIALMLPLKEVVPYTILVDRQTGYIETVRGLKVGELPQDQAVTEAFIAQFVLARETIDAADFDTRYRQVVLWSADRAQQEFLALARPDHPAGLVAAHREGVVQATVKQIELLDRQSARVRFDLVRRTDDAVEMREDWQAVLTFRYTGAPMRMEDRLVNPLGFQVTSYRRDREPDVRTSAPQIDATPKTGPEAAEGAAQKTGNEE